MRTDMPKRLIDIGEQLYEQNEYGSKHQKVDAKLTEEDRDFLRAEYGIDPHNKLHNMCVNCQTRQLIKYYGQAWDDNEPNKFVVRCSGVAKSLDISKVQLDTIISQSDMDKDRALLYLKSTKDPVAWCYLMFGFDESNPKWRLRPYQKEQLRCTALRMVIREGRRSGKTFIIALKLLYMAFNKLFSKGFDSEGNEIMRGPEIMIVTPYQSQVSNIFNEMEKILKRNEDLCSKVQTGTAGSLYVKTPFFRMEFANGAKISGFVSGVGTKVGGEGGGTMRGQSADIIYVDEMDMVPEDVLDKVVVPILLTTPEVILIATSTPIGKRAKFYNWCLSRPDFKEDYFPSTVLPHWHTIKGEVERENSEDGFRAEYLAEFIDGAHGVFRPSYIYNARQDYEYQHCESKNWWHKIAGVRETTELMTVIGIDWNKNAGTEFVVVSYSPSKHRWYVVEATNISASEFSSIRWKEEVIRLNYKWKPDYIYADEGYGHTIIEDLKLLGYETKGKKTKDRRDIETAKLPERLISFNFSSKVELVSPIDGTTFSKSGKEYIVENAVRIFEDGVIWYPETDEVLRKQLLNYVILRRSATTNKPIYGPENDKIGDHRLDALMLALAGLSLQSGIYSKNTAPVGGMTFLKKEDLDIRTMNKQGASAFDLLMGQAGKADRNGRRKFNVTQEDFLRGTHQQRANTRTSKYARSKMNQRENGGILEEMKRRAANPAEQSRDPSPRHQEVSRPHVVKTRRIVRRPFKRRGR